MGLDGVAKYKYKWSLMVQYGPRWANTNTNMGLDGPRWSLMGLDGPIQIHGVGLDGVAKLAAEEPGSQ